MTDVAGGKIKAKVQHSYTPEQSDELQLEIGDIIEVLKQEEEGWWEGNLNGVIGMFPSNFVEIIQDSADSPDKDDTKEAVKEIRPKKVQGVGLGNIFGSGPIKLRPTTGQTPGRLVEHTVDGHDVKEEKSSVNNDSGKGDDIVVKRDRNERAVVRFSYSAENDDELTLEIGDIISVLDKDIEDSGWWKGELHGKVGVFPDNFVELLPSEEVRPKKPPPPVVNSKTSSTDATEKSKSPKTVVSSNDKKSEADSTKRLTGLDKKDETKVILPNTEKPSKDKDVMSTSEKSQGLQKKAAQPPPIGRKPNQSLRNVEPSKPDLTKSTKATDDASERTGTSSRLDEGLNLDLVESSQKLVHPTANRAKLPNRRPPSQALLQSAIDDEKLKAISSEKRMSSSMTSSMEELKDESVKEKKSPVSSPWTSTSSTSVQSSGIKQQSKQPPSTSSVKATSSTVSSLSASKAAVSSSTDTSPATSVSQSAIDELKRDLQTLKANSVSKTAFNELKTEFEKLKKDTDHLRATYQKRIVELMNEIDEEKKGRLNMQVEIERIKKLVVDSAA